MSRRFARSGTNSPQHFSHRERFSLSENGGTGPPGQRDSGILPQSRSASPSWHTLPRGLLCQNRYGLTREPLSVPSRSSDENAAMPASDACARSCLSLVTTQHVRAETNQARRSCQGERVPQPASSRILRQIILEDRLFYLRLGHGCKARDIDREPIADEHVVEGMGRAIECGNVRFLSAPRSAAVEADLGSTEPTDATASMPSPSRCIASMALTWHETPPTAASVST